MLYVWIGTQIGTQINGVEHAGRDPRSGEDERNLPQSVEQIGQEP